jgi:hypothetical protein
MSSSKAGYCHGAGQHAHMHGRAQIIACITGRLGRAKYECAVDGPVGDRMVEAGETRHRCTGCRNPGIGSVSASRAASPHRVARGQQCASATLGDEALTTEKLKMANQLNVRVLWRMSLKPSGFRLRGECAPSDTGMLWRRSGLSSWFKKLSSAVVGSIHSPADRIHLKLIR